MRTRSRVSSIMTLVGFTVSVPGDTDSAQREIRVACRSCHRRCSRAFDICRGDVSEFADDGVRRPRRRRVEEGRCDTDRLGNTRRSADRARTRDSGHAPERPVRRAGDRLARCRPRRRRCPSRAGSRRPWKLRGAARGPGDRGGLHPAPEPSARRVEHPRPAGRQARPVREASRLFGRRAPAAHRNARPDRTDHRGGGDGAGSSAVVASAGPDRRRAHRHGSQRAAQLLPFLRRSGGYPQPGGRGGRRPAGRGQLLRGDRPPDLRRRTRARDGAARSGPALRHRSVRHRGARVPRRSRELLLLDAELAVPGGADRRHHGLDAGRGAVRPSARLAGAPPDRLQRRSRHGAGRGHPLRPGRPVPAAGGALRAPGSRGCPVALAARDRGREPARA